jgi:dimethylargininase
VDLALARDQHAGYVAALRECGVEVTELPADNARPDSVFVQDRVLALDGLAIVCPSAVESRRGEDRIGRQEKPASEVAAAAQEPPPTAGSWMNCFSSAA